MRNRHYPKDVHVGQVFQLGNHYLKVTSITHVINYTEINGYHSWCDYIDWTPLNKSWEEVKAESL